MLKVGQAVQLVRDYEPGSKVSKSLVLAARGRIERILLTNTSTPIAVVDWRGDELPGEGMLNIHYLEPAE